jgi:hypothetical protein
VVGGSVTPVIVGMSTVVVAVDAAVAAVVVVVVVVVKVDGVGRGVGN